MRFLDTCICVEFLRGRLAYGYQRMREEAAESFQLPAVVVAELWYGAHHGSDLEGEGRLVEAFTSAFEIVPFDADAAGEYGRLRQLLGSQGNMIGDRDLMIAASAISRRAVLVTNNVKDFTHIPNLPLESWAEMPL